MQIRSIKLTVLLLFLSIHAAVAGARTADPIWVEPRTYVPKNEPRKNTSDHNLRSEKSRTRGTHLRITPLEPKEIERRLKERSIGARKIGFSRPVFELDDTQSVFTAMDWRPLEGGGTVGHIQLDVPGAAALRLGLLFEKLPRSAELRFHGSGVHEVETIRGDEILAQLEMNRHSGEKSPDQFIYWSPVISGETIGLELYLPADLSSEDVQFSVDGISQLTIDPTHVEVNPLKQKAAASCNLDSRCYPDWSTATNAVARITFVEDGSSYLCTGTLLNDTAQSNKPYFLTANHCVSTQSTASTINTFWFFYSSSCNSGTPYNGIARTSGGAQLLYSSATTDGTFLLLNNSPPSGVTFSGWTNSTPSLGIQAAGLHNPTGDLQKISFGSTQAFLNCFSVGNGSFDCNSSSMNDASFIDLVFRSGTTEGGSSGSGIFLDGNRYLFGQLYGGDSSCSNVSGSNVYGLFSKTYSNGNLGQWLGSGKQAQTITLSAPSSVIWGSSTAISASSSSGLPVSIKSLSASICTVDQNTLRAVYTGECQLELTQAGNESYLPATLNSTITVTAPIYPGPNATLTVRITKGSGKITSAPAGIDCGDSCNYAFTKKMTVRLTATPAPGSKFLGWSGACTGKKLSCAVKLTSNKLARAKFN